MVYFRLICQNLSSVKVLCFSSSLDYTWVHAKIPQLWNKALSSLQTQKIVTRTKLFLLSRKYTFSIYYILIEAYTTFLIVHLYRCLGRGIVPSSLNKCICFPHLMLGPHAFFKENPGKKKKHLLTFYWAQ